MTLLMMTQSNAIRNFPILSFQYQRKTSNIKTFNQGVYLIASSIAFKGSDEIQREARGRVIVPSALESLSHPLSSRPCSYISISLYQPSTSSSRALPSIFISATALMLSVSALFFTRLNHVNLLLVATIAIDFTLASSNISEFLRCSSGLTPIAHRTILISVFDIRCSSLPDIDHVYILCRPRNNDGIASVLMVFCLAGYLSIHSYVSRPRVTLNVKLLFHDTLSVFCRP